jgi:hypothetical protein
MADLQGFLVRFAEYSYTAYALCCEDGCLQDYAVAQRKGVTPSMLEIVALALSIPGAIDALTDLLTRSAAGRVPLRRRGTTRFDIDLHVSIRRG